MLEPILYIYKMNKFEVKHISKNEIKRIKGIEICIICFTSSNHILDLEFLLCFLSMACKNVYRFFCGLKKEGEIKMNESKD